jgi:hypothetical protein
LVDNGAVVSAHELARVEAAMAAQFLRLSVERAREKGQGASEREGSVVAPLKTSRPDWWGHGRHTVATTHPCVGAGLWPVGHTYGSEL